MANGRGKMANRKYFLVTGDWGLGDLLITGQKIEGRRERRRTVKKH